MNMSVDGPGAATGKAVAKLAAPALDDVGEALTEALISSSIDNLAEN